MGDQLSQWRGYAEGGGYAIHYDAKPLRSSIRLYGLDGPNRFGERNALDQIAYETEDAGRYVEEILARLIPAICEQFHLDPAFGSRCTSVLLRVRAHRAGGRSWKDEEPGV